MCWTEVDCVLFQHVSTLQNVFISLNTMGMKEILKEYFRCHAVMVSRFFIICFSRLNIWKKTNKYFTWKPNCFKQLFFIMVPFFCLSIFWVARRIKNKQILTLKLSSKVLVGFRSSTCILCKLLRQENGSIKNYWY